MLMRRIIPCLDVHDGRVVKGVRFSELRDSGDPVELAVRYESQGADELALLDVSATPEGRRTAATVVAAIRRELSIPLTVGGGVRALDDISALLGAGADKVAINTAAVLDPSLIQEGARRFGRQCIVLAIDARAAAGTGGGAGSAGGAGAWEVIVRSGTSRLPLCAVEWAQRGAELGAGEILLTSWDRDGTRSGYDLALTRAVANTVSIPVIASGGAARPQHLLEALLAGADAVLAASIFHTGEFTVGDVKSFLQQHSVEIRT
jgi:imidazole glycerol-phosphate synthase subunit HisF